MAGRVTPCVPLPRSLRPQYPKTPASPHSFQAPLGSATLRLCGNSSSTNPQPPTLNSQPLEKREINHLQRPRRENMGKAASTDRSQSAFSHLNPHANHLFPHQPSTLIHQPPPPPPHEKAAKGDGRRHPRRHCSGALSVAERPSAQFAQPNSA